MKANTLKRKREILRRHTTDELKGIFNRRLDDEMFEAVGAMESSVAEQRHSEPHLLAWKGYELLVDSPYLVLR